MNTESDQRRRRARRTAIGLLLVALAFYVGFIIMSVRRSHG
jgi:cell division septal protein FtsQ